MCLAEGNANPKLSQGYVPGKHQPAGDKSDFLFCGAGYLKQPLVSQSGLVLAAGSAPRNPSLRWEGACVSAEPESCAPALAPWRCR